jgi:hypothetical protein
MRISTHDLSAESHLASQFDIAFRAFREASNRLEVPDSANAAIIAMRTSDYELAARVLVNTIQDIARYQ